MTVFSIETGSKEVLESGSFIALGLGETKVELGKGAEALCFIFDFKIDGKDEAVIELEKVGEKSLKLVLTNWNSTSGLTFVDPVRVGTFNGRELFLMTRIKKIGRLNEYRDVLVTAYLGEEVSSGQD